jgi:hypothetical protein
MGVAATQCVLGMLGGSSAVRSTCEVAHDVSWMRQQSRHVLGSAPSSYTMLGSYPTVAVAPEALRCV